MTHDIEEAVYLADRVLLLSGSPANVVSEFEIDLAHPRDREQPDFLARKQSIREQLQSFS